MIPAAHEPRPRCLRCWRPARLCYCRDLVPVATETRVVFLQHPRERAAAMGTARLAHLALANSELHVGAHPDVHQRVHDLAGDPTAALLYPDGDCPAPAWKPRTLVVIDGTWTTARKMLARTPALARLPRLRLAPSAPSAYRIRREPAPHCLSTVEAVAAALTELEGDAGRFAPMLGAFHSLVETQIDFAGTHRVPYRHLRARRGARAERLRDSLSRGVAVQVEGNPAGVGLGHELVLLAARRIATGESFRAVVRPRRAVHPRFAERAAIPLRALVEGGDPLDVARARWADFLRPGDVLVGWGTFSPRLLAVEDMIHDPWLDLRPGVIQRLRRRPGGVERAATALADAAPGDPSCGRAERRLEALVTLVASLVAGENR